MQGLHVHYPPWQVGCLTSRQERKVYYKCEYKQIIGVMLTPMVTLKHRHVIGGLSFGNDYE